MLAVSRWHRLFFISEPNQKLALDEVFPILARIQAVPIVVRQEQN
jgi:hypothetical protein